MAKRKKKRLGLLDPAYNYLLNPYPELKFSKCPLCEGKTGQRKLPIAIHVEPQHLISLNYTHRYCRNCDALIGHKHEIEQFLFQLFSERAPADIGNSYTIFGTMELKAWREGLHKSKSWSEALAHIHDFRTYEEIRMTMAGWFLEDTQPPVMQPVPSTVWVKSGTD